MIAIAITAFQWLLLAVVPAVSLACSGVAVVALATWFARQQHPKAHAWGTRLLHWGVDAAVITVVTLLVCLGVIMYGVALAF